MKVKREEDLSLNLMPVFADLGTIIIGFFIFIVVVLIKQLSQSELPIQLSTDQYFDKRSYLISKKKADKLSDHINQNIYPEISAAFKENRLKSLRIEGHTDPTPIKPKKKRQSLSKYKAILLGDDKIYDNDKFKITNNYELSFMRAQSVGDIFNEIIENDPTINVQEKVAFKNLIVFSAFGASKRNYGYRHEPKGSKRWEVFNKDTDMYMLGLTNLSQEAAKEATFKKLRRVEITPVIKGLRQ